jgi:hypothetical protein
MSNPQFVPLTAASLRNFYDAEGQPLGLSSKCPTCNRTNMFTIRTKGGAQRFSGGCGHAFEIPTPAK